MLKSASKNKEPQLAKELCIATNILGSPNEKRSAPQARDLRIICEAVGVGGSCLILSDDSRLLATIMNSDTIRQKVSMKNVLGVTYNVQVKSLREIVPELKKVGRQGTL